MPIDRRDFLKAGLAVGAMAKFGELNALAAGGGYQALVCIFLNGGNDGHNTVIPIQTQQNTFAMYQATRLGMALAQNTLKPIVTKSGDHYGLHPQLGGIQALYNSGVCAIVANAGMLVEPITRAQYQGGGVPVPQNLFSHSDQTTQWQNATPTGLNSSGWGGRMVDLLQVAGQNSGAQFPPITNTGGCGLFCTGNNNFPTTVPPQGAISLGYGGSAARQQGAQQLLTFDNGLKLVQAANGIVTRGNQAAATLNALIGGVALQTMFPAGNPLADQLKMVARIMAVRNQLSLTRQIFFCSLGGFDTHSGQLAQQDMLLQQLDGAVSAFYTATKELTVDTSVTTFTCSEFGRTLMPNSSGGTDHAWGGHHFAIGGSVKGGDLYGTFPLLALNTGNDATNRGAMIPGISVDQYGATLAAWFGVDTSNPANLAQIFPNINNFAVKNLGFV